MSIPLDKQLYAKVKQEADEKYEKPSAYKSGFIVKRYKEQGGRYADTGEEKGLKRWFNEKWTDVGNKEYPVYRPTVRVNKNTPLLKTEINESNMKKQIKLKQKIKGDFCVTCNAHNGAL